MENTLQTNKHKNLPVTVEKQAELSSKKNIIDKKDTFSDIIHARDTISSINYLPNLNGINVQTGKQAFLNTTDPLDILETNNHIVEQLDETANRNDSQQVLRANDTEHIDLGIKRRKNPVKKLKIVDNKCGICQKIFNCRPDFVKHAQISHPNEKAFNCSVCFMGFTNIHSVSRHRRIHNDRTQKHVCKFCSKTFLHTYSYKRHLEIHTTERSYECTLCDKIYKHKISLKKHQKTTHIEPEISENTISQIVKEEPNSNGGGYIDEQEFQQGGKHDEEYFKIETVEVELKADPLYDNLILNSQQELTFEDNCKIKSSVDRSCTVCHEEFNGRQNLVKHMKLHHPNAKARNGKILKNICPYCSKSFRHKYDFNRHIGTHYRKTVDKNRPAVDRKCAVCHEEFDMRLDLIDHVKRFHPNVKAFKCGLCPMVFTNIHYISRHRRIHDYSPTSKEHICEICSKSFKYNDSLKRHLITHTRKTSYSCSLCKKTFEHKNSLDNHKKIHSETGSNDCIQDLNVKKTPKPVVKYQLAVERKCAVCHQEFDYRHELFKHARQYHPNAKVFKCAICSMVFKNTISISRHSRIHKVAQKKYGCKICLKSFISKDFLRNHMRTHSRERPYSCFLSKKGDMHKDYLTIHRNTQNNFNSSLDIKVELDSDIIDDEPILQDNNTGEFFNNESTSNSKMLSTVEHNNKKTIRLPKPTLVIDTKCADELHMERESQDALEAQNSLVICKTEYVYDESIINAAKKVDNRDNATLEDGYISETPSCNESIPKDLPNNHICELCSQSFISVSQLRHHLRQHTMERSYSCSFCGKSYKRKYVMMKHQKNCHLNQ